MKINPFQDNSRIKEMLLAKSKEFTGKGAGSELSDDLWAAYQDLLARMPKERNELYEAWLDISSEQNPQPSFDVLGLSEYDDIYYRPENDSWWGVLDDMPKELPEMFQGFEDIWWDSKRNAFVGSRDAQILNNPRTNTMVYDAGRSSWFNILTGEVEI
jgi:hypothetical protein